MDSPPNAKRQKLEETENEDDKSETTHPAAEKYDSHIKPVCEVDVGITEYISKHDGFQGIIKQRYSDFLVNEIGLAGTRMTLTDIEAPTCDVIKEDICDEVDLLPEEKMDQLQNLFESTEAVDPVSIEAGEDKERRTNIHRLITRKFPGLVSRTEIVDNVRCIVVTKRGSTNNGGSSKSGSNRKAWEHKGTDYCQCVLYKENMDTMFAVNILSKYLGGKTNMITYAGTKDKRAKTCQLVSFYRLTASRLYALNKKLRDMALGNFRYCSKPLALGDLSGNHFNIILRSVTGSDDQLSEAMESLQQYGFINYYGMQRFGTTAIPTHLVGRELLKSNWKEAIDLIMTPRSPSHDPIHEARQCWNDEHDADKALRLIKKRACPEYHLLNGLKTRNTNDYVGALGCIPRNNRLMYIHAYQSYLWNRLVSHRLRDFGLLPVVGDLVIKANLLPSDHTGGDVSEQKNGGPDKRIFTEPTVVTEDNISGYTIHDVVLPLVGYDVVFPQNLTGQLYESWLAADGLSVAGLKHKVKDYALRGTYRHIVIQLKDLSWELIRYDDPNIPLVLSDLELLQNKQLPAQSQGSSKALRLEFSLPSSTYATMAIREVLKQDTSAAHQSTLTAATKSSTPDDTLDNSTVSTSGVLDEVSTQVDRDLTDAKMES